MEVHLGAKHGLADDADNELLPVTGHPRESAPLTCRTNRAGVCRMQDEPRLAKGARAVSTISNVLTMPGESWLVEGHASVGRAFSAFTWIDGAQSTESEGGIPGSS